MANMVITSVTVTTPLTTPVFPNENVLLLGINIFTTNPDNPFDVTDIFYDGGLGSTFNDYVSVTNIYGTGASSVYSTSNLLTTGAVPGAAACNTGADVLTFTETLLEGDNYFWISVQLVDYLPCPVDLSMCITSISFSGAGGSWNSPGDFNGDPAGSRTLQTMDGALPADASSTADCDPTISWTAFSPNYAIYISTSPTFLALNPAPTYSTALTSVLLSDILGATPVCGTTYYWFVSDLANPSPGTPIDCHTAYSFSLPPCQEITVQPVSLEDCADSVGLTMSITDTGATGYQWYKDGVAIGDGLVYSGTNTDTLTFLFFTETEEGDYTCGITGVCDEVISDIATVTVNQVPKLVTEPVAQSICNGDAVELFVEATGGSLTYQWYHFTPPLPFASAYVNGGAISGATSDTLTIDPLTATQYSVYCEIINACGSVSTTPVTITRLAPPAVRGNPSPVTICEGEPFTLNASTSPSVVSAVTYQWYKDATPITNDPPRLTGASGTVVSASTPLVVTSAVVGDEGDYYCTYTNVCGDTSTSTVAVTINPLPSVVTPPDSVSDLPGANVNFSLVAANAVSYQWDFNGVDIVGATTNSLAVNNITFADAGVYTCTITNACGSITASATLVTIPVVSDVCCFDASFELYAGVGSYWTGTGVQNNFFFPSVAGIGTHLLTLHSPTGDVSTNINVLDCDPYDAKLKLLSCCLGDKVHSALDAKKKGLVKTAQKRYSEAKYLTMALDLLRCRVADSEEVFPTWGFVIDGIAGDSSTASLYWGDELLGSGTGTFGAPLDNMVTAINASGTGWTAEFSYPNFTLIAPSCLYSGKPTLEINEAYIPILSQDAALSGGSCEVVNCLTEAQVDKIWAVVNQICGCDCKAAEVVSDNVDLSSGRKYSV